MRRLLTLAIFIGCLSVGQATDASNVTTGNPWIIDTAASTTIVTKNIKIKMIVWDGSSAAAADTITIKDAGGIVKFQAVMAAVTLGPMQWTFPDPGLISQGLIVSALTHGTLYIYVSNDSVN